MEINVKLVGDATLIELIGDLDMYNAPVLKERVQRIIREGAAGVVIDAGRVEYVDSSGIGALIIAFTASQKSGIPLRIAGVHGTVMKVIELTRLQGILPLTATVEASLALLMLKKKAVTV